VVPRCRAPAHDRAAPDDPARLVPERLEHHARSQRRKVGFGYRGDAVDAVEDAVGVEHHRGVGWTEHAGFVDVHTAQFRELFRWQAEVGGRPSQLADLKRALKTPKLKIDFKKGDRVKVTSGPFFDFTGLIDEIQPEKEKVRALISIFGRETPVELEFYQIEKV